MTMPHRFSGLVLKKDFTELKLDCAYTAKKKRQKKDKKRKKKMTNKNSRGDNVS